MSREPIRHRNSLPERRCLPPELWGISRRFQRLFPSDGQVAHALRTLPPVAGKVVLLPPPAAPRLACVKPAASVHPEPGSNSPLFISIFSIFYNEFLSCLASCSSFSELRDLMSLVLFTTFTLLCLVAILSLFSCSRIRRSRLRGGCRIVPDCGCKISAFPGHSQVLS